MDGKSQLLREMEDHDLAMRVDADERECAMDLPPPLASHCSHPCEPSFGRCLDQPSKRLYILYDNSNVWIEGKRVSNHRKSPNHPLAECPCDPTWRLSSEALFRLILEKNPGFEITRAWCVGSEPPPVDSVWKSFARVMKVKKFKRSAWTGQEKCVDNHIQKKMTSLLENCVAAQERMDEGQGPDSVYKKTPRCLKILGIEKLPPATEPIMECTKIILLSGDGDYSKSLSGFKKEEHPPVEIWSWKHSLGKIYETESSPFGVVELDDYFESIGFNDTRYELHINDLKVESTFIISGALNAPEMVHSWIKKNCDFCYRLYDEKEDVLFIHLQWDLGIELGLIIKDCKDHFAEIEEIFVDSLFNYKNQKPTLENLLLANPYAMLNIPMTTEKKQKLVVTRNPESEWTQVKTTKASKNTFVAPKTRCNWGIYCKDTNKCTFGHLAGDYDQWMLLGQPKSCSKIRYCKDEKCPHLSHPARCKKAHGQERIFCPTCGETGKHEMTFCPRRNEAWKS